MNLPPLFQTHKISFASILGSLCAIMIATAAWMLPNESGVAAPRQKILHPVPTTSAALTGEKAIDHLKATGHYESLSEAMTAAQYGVREVDGDAENTWAYNPKHRLNSRFDQNGLRLTVRTPGEASFTTAWRLEQLGYGDNQHTVPAGDLRRDGQRAEIVRGELGLTEWFVNQPAGLEHGFTLLNRPANPVGNDQPLTLTLAVAGDLEVHAIRDGQALQLRDPESGATVLTYDKLKVWDADERPVTARMRTAAAENAIVYEVDDAGARYPLTIDPMITQQAYLKPSNFVGSILFSHSLAMDGTTAVIGAYPESRHGAAYVFVRDASGNWIQQAYLTASNAEFGDEFGFSVAISGDTIVAGARYEAGDASSTSAAPNNNASHAGAAYVFVRDAMGNWAQQAYLKASNAYANAASGFGYSVAVSGNTVLIGWPDELGDANSTAANPNTNGGERTGAAYIFTRAGGIWTQQAYLKAFNAHGKQSFGESVALDGETAVIGARGDAGDANSTIAMPNLNSGAQTGAAFIFTGSGATWTMQAYLKAFNAMSHTNFGFSVAVDGDTAIIGSRRENGDANSTVAAPNTNAALAGAAYIYTRSAGNWTLQDYLKASNAEGLDEFGYSVALSGDTAVIGAYFEDGDATSTAAAPNNNADAAGAAYLFTRDANGDWTEQEYFKAANADPGDWFGHSVAVHGDIVLIGARNENGDANSTAEAPNNNGSEAGAAYIFSLPFTPAARMTYQPDLRIGERKSPKKHKGNNIYNRMLNRGTGGGGGRQRLTLTTVNARPIEFYLSLQNDGSETDTLTLRSLGYQPKYNFRFREITGGATKNVTAAVKANRYRATLDPGDIRHFEIHTRRGANHSATGKRTTTLDTFFLSKSTSTPSNRAVDYNRATLIFEP